MNAEILHLENVITVYERFAKAGNRDEVARAAFDALIELIAQLRGELEAMTFGDCGCEHCERRRTLIQRATLLAAGSRDA